MKRISERRLGQVQAVSGILFATFLLLHLANTALALFGQGVYDGYQQAVRRYYQATGVELALIGLAPAVHVAVGLVRMRRRQIKARGKRRRAPPWRVRLHRYSGYVLVLFFGAHVLATRGPGLWLGQPADFAFLTYSLWTYPFVFYPYYALFVLAGLHHLLHGLIAAAPVLRVKLPRAWHAPRAPRFWIPVALAGVVLLMGLIALGGAFFEVDTARFDEVDALWARFRP